MLGWLRGKRTSEPESRPVRTTPLEGGLPWLQGAALPIPDWARAEERGDAATAAWLDALAGTLPHASERTESPHFMLLSPLQPRAARVLLDYLERSRKRVLATLPGIAQGLDTDAKTVVLVFGDQASYYRYVSHYGGNSGAAEGLSSGMFIDAGLGHFVFVGGPFEHMEPVVVHELTHCLVRHLPIPAWLNEGLAVNTEHRFTPARPRYRPNELQYLFGRFWTAETIQEFWTGKSFLRPDDGQPLSYELARLLVSLLDKDYEMLAGFCRLAQREDGGEQAAREVLGAGLQELAAVVLGEGTWAPQPAAWAAGTEKGQF